MFNCIEYIISIGWHKLINLVLHQLKRLVKTEVIQFAFKKVY